MLKHIKNTVVVQPVDRFLPPESRFMASVLEVPRQGFVATPSLESARSATWAPAAASRIRFVEAGALVCVMGYFAFGLLSTLIG